MTDARARMTYALHCRVKKVFRIQIRFQGSEIRRG